MLAADEQAAAAHGLPRIDATNAAQYRPPDLTEDPDNRAARLEPTSAARLWFWARSEAAEDAGNDQSAVLLPLPDLPSSPLAPGRQA